ncbi:MAG TPA: 4-alpha-glucanotransferase, partial [Solirubrobacteraceae bacterium]|nr:4-alpha-glucanotransferase [Solirubrobacteraceae bacterium]
DPLGKQRGVKAAIDSNDVRSALSQRSSGVLLHVTSLPGRRLGGQAFAFVDWLAEAGQRWWQLLPVGPPDRYGSPYKSRSAFAGWTGLLAEPRARVSAEEKIALREREAYWIEDWIRLGPRDALADQVRFDREWARLREYAVDRGVRLLGDLAIYVAPGSVDHRGHPRLFQTGLVAGAPPDAFAEKGQLWGNPLYDWPVMRRSGYRWWVERLRRTLELFDGVRLDHFRGFVAYWAVPEGDGDATRGSWKRGPGEALFRAFARELGAALPLVAEDLGVITPPVERLREALGVPGMLVLQFGFDPRDPHSPHRLANHVPNRVVYTGTHDHDTARGWYESLPGAQRATVDGELRRAGIASSEPWWGLIELALTSPARTSIFQAQDVLGLGSRARMNDPSRVGGNWRWEMAAGALTPDLAKRLRELTEAAGRTGAPG